MLQWLILYSVKNGITEGVERGLLRPIFSLNALLRKDPERRLGVRHCVKQGPSPRNLKSRDTCLDRHASVRRPSILTNRDQ